MATTVDELLIKIRSDMSEFKRDLSKIQNQTQKATKSIDRSFKTMATGVKGAIGAVVAIGAVQLGRSMVGLASDVEEQTSKARVVFGNNFGAVRNELEAFGDAVGRATPQLVNMGASVQDTFVPMGFAREEASKLSVQLTKLAVDVASFNNASDEETMRAFQSAIVGNHETVRRFGVVITEATLKQELNRMGIKKNMKEVTNAEKVQARLNLIINGTTDAHNDAIKTSGSFANTTKALSSALQELNVAIMTPLLPVLTKIVRSFVNAVEAVKSFLSILDVFRGESSDLQKTNDLLAKRAELETQLAVKLAQRALIEQKLAEFESVSTFGKILSVLGGENSTGIAGALGEAIEKAFPFSGTGFESEIEKLTNQINSMTHEMDKLNVKIRDGQLVTEKNVETLKEEAEVRLTLGKLLPFQIKLLQDETKTRTFLHGRQLSQIETLKKEQLFADEFEKAIQVNKLERIKEGRRVREEEAKRLKAIENELRDTSIQAFDRITDATADLLDGTTKNFDGIRSAMSMFLKDLQRTILQLTVFNNIKNRIFGTNLTTASGGEIFDNIIGLFAGGSSGGGGMLGGGSFDFLAGGGRVQRGRPTIVGERGAEMFVPNTGGTILNNMNTRRLGGGSTVVNQTINVDAGVSQTVRAEIINLLPVIKQDTISSLLEAKRRGGSFATALA
tara:strand:- start:6077 stop:8107 length:2031 start_codon:yes stop_codon:yes gene_type:complete